MSINVKRYADIGMAHEVLQTFHINREFAELAYKYLFSISPVSPEGEVIGLCIFNGLPETENQRDSLTNIYDFEQVHPITPRADVVTLTENAKNNSSLHDALLRNSIGRYVTEEPLKTVPLPASDDEENTTPSPALAVVEPKEPETSAQGNTASRPAEDSGSATSEESHSSFAEKQNVSQNSTMTSREKGSQKKKPPKAIDASALHLSELKLDKDIEARLIGAGYTTIQDLVPNKLKSDLVSNPILNRKSRREIEARLKQRKIPLR